MNTYPNKTKNERDPFELRFVHTADLHLDSPLSSLALRDPQLADLVSDATRQALSRIVDLCIEHEVHALLIAGDLYDGEQKSMGTAALLAQQMRRLQNERIPVFIIRGNHDAQSVLRHQLSLPDNVHVFDGRGGTVEIADGRAAIHGVSFSKPHAPDSLLPKYRSPHAELINIGMLHTSLAASGKHAIYAPCALSELQSFGYDYWALGHIHKRSVHSTDPTVLMPGIPQGRDVGEDGPRSVSLVSINTQHEVSVSEHTVAPVQFERIELHLPDFDSLDALHDGIHTALTKCKAQSASEQTIARLYFAGESDLQFAVQRDTDVLLALAREYASAIGNIWVEAIRSVPPTLDALAAVADSSDVLQQLASIVKNDVLSSEVLKQACESELQEMRKKLPPEMRFILGNNEQEYQDNMQQWLEQGSALLLAQLRAKD